MRNQDHCLGPRRRRRRRDRGRRGQPPQGTGSHCLGPRRRRRRRDRGRRGQEECKKTGPLYEQIAAFRSRITGRSEQYIEERKWDINQIQDDTKKVRLNTTLSD